MSNNEFERIRLSLGRELASDCSMVDDKEHGLVYVDGADPTPWQTPKVRYMHQAFSNILLTDRRKAFNAMVMHPVGTACVGACSYCDAANLHRTVRPEDVMTPERIVSVVSELKALGMHDPDGFRNVTFAGGEPLLHEDLDGLTSALDSCIDNRYRLRISTGLLVDERMYKKFIAFLEKNKESERRDVFLNLSGDIGSCVRKAPLVGVTHEKAAARLREILEIGDKSDGRLVCQVHSAISSFMTVDAMMKEAEELSKYKSLRMSFQQFAGSKHDVDVPKSVTDSFYAELSKRFPVTDASRHMMVTTDSHGSYVPSHHDGTYMLELEPGVYRYYPFKHNGCRAFVNQFGFDQTGYFPGFFGQMRTDTLFDSLVMSPQTNKEHREFLSMPKWCTTCDNISHCTQCRRRRWLNPCTEYRSMKNWEDMKWNHVKTRTDTWKILSK